MRAAIYCRISKDTDDTRLGVERQEKDCQKLCADRGWHVVEPSTWTTTSQRQIPKKRRPEYERLLEGHRQPARSMPWSCGLRIGFTGVLAELESFVTACDAAGLTKLASVGGDTNLNDPDALMVLRIKGSMAAREVAVTVEDESSERCYRRLRLASGTVADGHSDYKDGGIEINETEAVLVREAADEDS